MKTRLISRSCSGRYYLNGKKVSYTDPRVYVRILICMCVFVVVILCLLHCSNVDSSSTNARISPSSSKISHVIEVSKSSFSFFIGGKPSFTDETLSFSSLNDVDTPPVDPIYTQKPYFPSLHSGELPSLPTHTTQKPSPSSSNYAQGSSFLKSIATPMAALHGLGTLFVRGTISVSELVIAHVEETTSVQELKMFLRTFHRSGMSARADMVFLFTSNGLSEAMEHVILKEHTHFCDLLSQNKQKVASIDQALNNASHHHKDRHPKSTVSPFKYDAFSIPDAFNSPIWGCDPCDCVRSSKSRKLGNAAMEFGFGSIAGFDVSELNPDDNLQGFIDDPPLNLRRWACYQMLLGMVKHEFKQVMLTAVSGVLILGDPLAVARKRVGLYLSLEDITWGSPVTVMDEIEGKEETAQGNSHDIGGLDSENVDADAGAFLGVEGLEDAGKDKTGKNEEAFNDLDAVKLRGPDSNAGVMHAKMSLFHAPVRMKRAKSNIIHASSSQHAEHNTVNLGAQKMTALSFKSLEDADNVDSGDDYERSLKQGMGTMQKLTRQRKGYMDRRIRQRRKTQKAIGGGGGGLYERVYGRTMWSMLDDGEKDKRLLNSAVIVGDVRHIRGVAITMVTEIVKVALNRGSREAFSDSVLLSHLVHNRNLGVLGKKVVEHLHILDNSASFVHSFVGSRQPSLFLQGRNRPAYPIISEGQCKRRLWRSVVDFVHEDICSSSVDAAVYKDCLQ